VVEHAGRRVPPIHQSITSRIHHELAVKFKCFYPK
jgi:hypothetical protein